MKPDFFIIGSARSGTTLIRLILNAHSQITVPRESYFITELYKYSHANRLNLVFQPDYEQYVNRLCDNSHFETVVLKPLKLDREEIRKELIQARLKSEPEVFDFVYDLFARKCATPLVGDKTPRYSVDLDIILDLFPESKFIYVVRDGRSIYASLKRVEWSWQNKNEIALSRQWHYCMEVMEQHIDVIGPKLHIINYEEMVRSPEKVMQETCRFLEVDFENQILEFHKESRSEIRSGDGEVPEHRKKLQSPISTDSIDAWRRELNSNEVLLFELLNAKHFKFWGYRFTINKLNALRPSFIWFFLSKYWPYKLNKASRS